MKLDHKRIGKIAVCFLLAGVGYAAGWWHHSVRHAVSTAPDKPLLIISKPDGDQDAPIKGDGDRPLSEAGSTTGGGESPDYGQIVRQILADPDKANYHSLYEPFRQWAKQDPAAASAAFLAEPKLQAHDLPNGLFFELGRQDPQSALALLAKLPRKSLNEKAADALAHGWALVSPESAAAAGLAMPDGLVRRKFLSSVATKWMWKDPVGLAAWLKSLPREENLGAMLGYLHLPVGNVKSADAMSAAMEVYQLAPESGRGSMVLTFNNWLNSSPGEAIAWAFQLPAETPNRKEILASAAERTHDREAALNLLASLTSADARLILTKGIADSWAKSDVEAAWRWVSELNDPKAQTEAFAGIRARLIAESPDKAVPFLFERQPDQISTWGPEAAAAWAKLEPDAALAWTKSLTPEQRGGITSRVIRAIAEVDGAKAFGEAIQVSDERIREDLINRTATAFARENVTLASARIDAMPRGPDRDLAIDGLLQPAFEIEPDSAFRWALAIDNPKHREESVAGVFPRWFHSNPAAATAWLDRNSFSDELRQRLRTIIPQLEATRIVK